MTKIALRSLRGSLRAGAAVAALAVCAAVPASASEDAGGGHGVAIARQAWSFGGFKGQYDKAQLQRGWQVYQDVCAACHGLKRLAFRNLVQPGGPEFPEESVKTLAAGWANKIVDGPDDNGKMFERPPLLSDPILGPYKNEKEARAAQNGALPPDLTLMAKARNVAYLGTWYGHPLYMLKDIISGYQEGGADYLYALMTSYQDQPPTYNRNASGHLVAAPDGKEQCASVTVEHGKPDVCVKLNDGMNYNTAFAGHQIGMPPPLGSGKDAEAQKARDVTAFLSWAADPTLNQRKRMGWVVLLYLAATTVLLWLGKKRIWAKAH